MYRLMYRYDQIYVQYLLSPRLACCVASKFLGGMRDMNQTTAVGYANQEKERRQSMVCSSGPCEQ